MSPGLALVAGVLRPSAAQEVDRVKTEAAIEILLAGLYETDPEKRPSPEDINGAQEHIVSTREAWGAFVELYQLAADRDPPNRELMESLFGCDPTLSWLEEFAGLDAKEIAAANPRLAAHLAHCGECADIFAAANEFAVSVTREVEKLSPGAEQTMVTGRRVHWRGTLDELRRKVHETAEAITYGVRQRIPQFLDFPPGMVPQLAAAVRSALDEGTGGRGMVEQLSFDLPIAGVTATLRIGGEPDNDRFDLFVSLDASRSGNCSLELLEQASGNCIAAESTAGAATVAFSGIRRGNYLLRFDFIDLGEIAVCRLDLVP